MQKTTEMKVPKIIKKVNIIVEIKLVESIKNEINNVNKNKLKIMLILILLLKRRSKST